MIRKLAGGEAPPLPAFLRGPDWERACRGLLAVAINNQDGALAKDYDLGRPDDAVALSLLKGVDHWTFSVDDADAIVLRAAAACVGGEASEAIARAIESLLKQEPRAARTRGPGSEARNGPRSRRRDDQRSLWPTCASSTPTARSASRPSGFGTLADFAAVVEDEFRSADATRQQQDAPKPAKP